VTCCCRYFPTAFRYIWRRLLASRCDGFRRSFHTAFRYVRRRLLASRCGGFRRSSHCTFGGVFWLLVGYDPFAFRYGVLWLLSVFDDLSHCFSYVRRRLLASRCTRRYLCRTWRRLPISCWGYYVLTLGTCLHVPTGFRYFCLIWRRLPAARWRVC
jgi:hypothetical protein